MDNYGEFRSARERGASLAELRSIARGFKHPDLRRLALTQAWEGVDMAKLARETIWRVYSGGLGYDAPSTWIPPEAQFSVKQGARGRILAHSEDFPETGRLAHLWAVDKALHLLGQPDDVSLAWINALRTKRVWAESGGKEVSWYDVHWATWSARSWGRELTRPEQIAAAALKGGNDVANGLIHVVAQSDHALSADLRLDFARCLLTALRERDLG